jgi:mRNA interferase RelE/StbE
LTKFNVLISETARRQLYELDSKNMERIKTSIKELESNPFSNRPKADVKKLKGSRSPELYRLRVGDFRIIYTVTSNDIKISEIIRRSKGYEWLD